MVPDSHPPTKSGSRSSSESNTQTLKSPRTVRIAEATSVKPPEPSDPEKSPFTDPPKQLNPAHDVSDFGFGYVNTGDRGPNTPRTCPPASPLRSALKSPGSPARNLDVLSPTFKEEYVLEKHEQSTEKENAKDLVSGERTSY